MNIKCLNYRSPLVNKDADSILFYFAEDTGVSDITKYKLVATPIFYDSQDNLRTFPSIVYVSDETFLEEVIIKTNKSTSGNKDRVKKGHAQRYLQNFHNNNQTTIISDEGQKVRGISFSMSDFELMKYVFKDTPFENLVIGLGFKSKMFRTQHIGALVMSLQNTDRTINDNYFFDLGNFCPPYCPDPDPIP